MKRVALGMTQQDFADALDVTREAVSHWEHDTSTPRMALLRKIADVLKTSQSFLLEIEEDNPVAATGGARYRNTGPGTSTDAVAAAFDRMLQRRRLRSVPQIVVYTGAVLTADDVRRLQAGESPSTFPEELMVRFLRKFNLDDIRAYYAAAGLPLPKDFIDLEAELRDVLRRIDMYNDNSPETLEYVIQVAREEIHGKGDA